MRISDWSSDVCSSDLNYDGGLHHLAPDGGITRYAHDDADPDSLPSDTVWSLAFDSNGTLWIGTLAGLAKFQDGRIGRVAMPVEGTPRLYSTTMIRDALYVGNAQRVSVTPPDGPWSNPARPPHCET